MTTTRLMIDGVDLSEPAPGRVLPPRAFTSPAVYEAELDRVFARSWVHVADVTELARPGDFVAAAIGATPVVVVRGQDGAVRTFLNACRHRGTTLAEGRGNCGRSLDCPYHAWSYATDGRLIGVPDREEFAGCDLQAMGLVPVRTGVAAPMVFACLDAAAPPLEEWLGELPAALVRGRAADMRLAFERTYDVDVNWKVYVENGLEGYHVRFVHDMLNDLVETDAKTAAHFFEEHGSYTHALVKPEAAAMIGSAPHLTTDGRTFIRFGHVFPNLIPVLSPEDFSYLRIDPLGPERIRLVARSFDLGTSTPEMVALRQDSFDRTNQQDIGAVTRVQRGLHARGLPAGVHSSYLETRIGHFERMVARALAGGTSALAHPGPITYAGRMSEVA
jgi:phenylpropionate dioxygenase-like ring-hydroxylating dioxygenase large terminal subunit